MKAEDLRRRSGCRRERADPRDRIMLIDALPESYFRKKQLSRKVDYSSEVGPVGDQGDYGSCVGWAIADGLREWQEFKQRGRRVELSVMYLWNRAKEIDEVPYNEYLPEEGTTIKAGLRVLKKFGVPEEQYWPYGNEATVKKKELDILGREYRISHYWKLKSDYSRRYQLENRGPFLLSLPMYTNWDDAVDESGVVPMPPEDFVSYEKEYYDPLMKPEGRYIGGHAVLVVGYDDEKRRYTFKNSWGTTWGVNGFGYLSYEYLEAILSPPYSTDGDAWECYAAEDLEE